MSAAHSNTAAEIDDAEEAALLMSDDDNLTEEQSADQPMEITEDSLDYEAAGVSHERQHPPEDSSDLNDSSDDDDDDKEEEKLSGYDNIKKELAKNQYQYDKYVELCELSHELNNLDHIRESYKMFAKAYPLAEELWLRYLKVEVSLAQSAEEIEKTVKLFREALNDYYSIAVAKELAEFAARTATPEEIWLEILGTYGLSCLHGQEFFKHYRQYLEENKELSAVEKKTKTLQSFITELKYPLLNRENDYVDFRVECETNRSEIPDAITIDWDAIDKLYYKAKDHLKRILPFEEQLNTLDKKAYSERFEIYKKYIVEMDKALDENVLQTIYERMVADCCLNVNAWFEYINFIEYRDEYGRPRELQDLPMFRQDALAITKRALRNCAWSEKLYIKQMHLLEKQGSSKEEVQEILENSLAAGFQTPEPAVAIWMEYLTYLRRNTNWGNESDCEILRKTFNLAWTILGQQWGVLADCNCEILQFWGRLEYGPLDDPKRGKELWDTVMGSSNNSSKSGLWIEFLHLEMRRELESARKLFRKALHSVDLDNPAVIAAAWERFERCNGNIKTLKSCLKDCTYILEQYAAVRQQHDFSGSNKFKAHTTPTDRGTKRKSTPGIEVGTPERKKQKHTPPSTRTEQVAHPHASHAQTVQREKAFKEHENQEIDLTKDHLRVFLSNLDYKLTEDDIRAGLSELDIVSIELVCAANGRSRGFAYMELASEAEVEKALAKDRCDLNGRPLFVSSVLRDKEKRQKFKYSDDVEPKKLFIKSLPPDTTKEELEKIYAAFGPLKDVRLVYHKSGKFKNIAYVEYVDESAAGKAVLATNDMELRQHKLNVAISAPPPKPNAAPINVVKMLGMSSKRQKNIDQQKPRMSFIPNIVRKKVASTEMPPPAVPPASKGLAATTSTNGTAPSGKSNEDFRKLLLK